MKKLLFLLSFLALSMNIMAEKDAKAFSLFTAYGTEIKNIGFGLKGQYYLTDEFRSEVGFTRFLNNRHTNMWDINANMHYVFNISSKLAVYPLLGFTLTNWGLARGVTDDATGKSEKVWDYTTRFGANVGGGIQYNVSPRTFYFIEAKNQIVNKAEQLTFSFGVGMNF